MALRLTSGPQVPITTQGRIRPFRAFTGHGLRQLFKRQQPIASDIVSMSTCSVQSEESSNQLGTLRYPSMGCYKEEEPLSADISMCSKDNRENESPGTELQVSKNGARTISHPLRVTSGWFKKQRPEPMTTRLQLVDQNSREKSTLKTWSRKFAFKTKRSPRVEEKENEPVENRPEPDGKESGIIGDQAAQEVWPSPLSLGADLDDLLSPTISLSPDTFEDDSVFDVDAFFLNSGFSSIGRVQEPSFNVIGFIDQMSDAESIVTLPESLEEQSETNYRLPSFSENTPETRRSKRSLVSKMKTAFKRINSVSLIPEPSNGSLIVNVPAFRSRHDEIKTLANELLAGTINGADLANLSDAGLDLSEVNVSIKDASFYQLKDSEHKSAVLFSRNAKLMVYETDGEMPRSTSSPGLVESSHSIAILKQKTNLNREKELARLTHMDGISLSQFMMTFEQRERIRLQGEKQLSGMRKEQIHKYYAQDGDA